MSNILKIEKIENNRLFLHTELASGEYGDWKFRLIQDVASGTLVVQYSRGEERKQFITKLGDVMDCFIHAFEEDEKAV